MLDRRSLLIVFSTRLPRCVHRSQEPARLRLLEQHPPPDGLHGIEKPARRRLGPVAVGPDPSDHQGDLVEAEPGKMLGVSTRLGGAQLQMLKCRIDRAAADPAHPPVAFPGPVTHSSGDPDPRLLQGAEALDHRNGAVHNLDRAIDAQPHPPRHDASLASHEHARPENRVDPLRTRHT